VGDGDDMYPGSQWDQQSRGTGKPMLFGTTSVPLDSVARHNTQSLLPVALLRRSCRIVYAIWRREAKAHATATSAGGRPLLRTPRTRIGGLS
jgi:hypothetical protein